MSTETPITDALIDRVMREYPGVSAKAQADYYEAVHQELAPLAREFEKQIARLKADMQSMWVQGGKHSAHSDSGREG